VDLEATARTYKHWPTNPEELRKLSPGAHTDFHLVWNFMSGSYSFAMDAEK
jgi:hypothetical protein